VRIPDPLIVEPEPQLTDRDIAAQRAGARRLERILDLADRFGRAARRRNPAADPARLAQWAIEKAAQRVNRKERR
jgi:hypothetical protein